MVKIIFFDIDGTLVSFKKHIMPETAKHALLRLKEKNIKLVIASGRANIKMDFIKKLFDFDAYITANGQYCLTADGTLIHEKAIPSEDIKNVIPYLEKNNIACDFVEKDIVYLNLLNEKARSFYAALGNTLAPSPVMDTKRAICNKIYQISPYIEEEDEKQLLSYMPNSKSARWNPQFTDILPKDGGKDYGIQKVLEWYNLRQEDTMAFGDGGNDIDMLQFAKIGVAMGNAGEHVKESADYVTSDVDQDGLYNALIHFGII